MIDTRIQELLRQGCEYNTVIAYLLECGKHLDLQEVEWLEGELQFLESCRGCGHCDKCCGGW